MSSDLQERSITDAVVVLPGIMGSELVDASGEVVWGMKLSMARAFLKKVYDGVAVTPDELDGSPRLRPKQLIKGNVLLSLFGAQGPYTGLVKKLRGAAVDSAAVMEFPYDWRLSIEHNARQLVPAARKHLESWKSRLADLVMASDGPLRKFDVESVKLSFVAHSMGGLVTRFACLDTDLASVTRMVVSLGTPYRGSAQTIDVLNRGKTPPFLDSKAAQALAVTCPGFYDLLPREACVRDGGAWRALTPLDVESMGGSAVHAEEALSRWQKIHPKLMLPGVEAHQVFGFTMKTPVTMGVGDDGDWHCGELNWDGNVSMGDGTVAISKPPVGTSSVPYAVSHIDLPGNRDVQEAVFCLLRGVSEPPLTLAERRGLGLAVPLTTEPGSVKAFVNEEGVSKPEPSGITVTSCSENSNGQWSGTVGWVYEGRADDCLVYSRSLGPGLHRINVTGGGDTGVSCITAVLL